MKTTLAVTLCTTLAVSACSAAQPNSGNPAAMPTNNKGSAQTSQSFEAFFNDFKLALSQDKSDTLQSHIHFPLTVRGELDDSPTLILNELNVAAFLTDYLAEPVYMEKSGELIGHSLEELAAHAAIPRLNKIGQASWQGMRFKPIEGKWALVEIITYDHLIELHQ